MRKAEATGSGSKGGEVGSCCRALAQHALSKPLPLGSLGGVSELPVFTGGLPTGNPRAQRSLFRDSRLVSWFSAGVEAVG